MEFSRHALNGDLDRVPFRTLPADEVLKALQALPGIGPWSAAVLLLRGRRMNVFPPGDTARNLTALLGHSALLTPAETSLFAARFGNCRGDRSFISWATGS